MAQLGTVDLCEGEVTASAIALDAPAGARAMAFVACSSPNDARGAALLQLGACARALPRQTQPLARSLPLSDACHPPTIGPHPTLLPP